MALVATTLPIAGCDGGARGGVLGVPPPSAPIHLTDLPGKVSSPSGSPPLASETAPLRLGSEALKTWRTTASDGELRFESPGIGGIEGVGTLRVRLSPGGAQRVAVVPHAAGAQSAREHRALRRLELSLERDADPDAVVEIAVNLHEALHGNFGDAGRGGRLEKLEIILPGADPKRAELHSLRLERRSLLPPGAAADSLIVDHRGVLRPSWVVRGGAVAEIGVDVPGGGAELRWHDAATKGTGPRRVEVVHAGETYLLSDEPAAAGGLAADWSPRAASLVPWAGQRVDIRLRVEASGVGFFGNPTIVETPAGARVETLTEASVENRHNDDTPDVLVYLIDTLRADHLGVAAADRPAVSPTLDRLAREGVSFRRAQSSSPWTKPAIATLMSGLLPTAHRVGATSYTDRMPATVPLVQEQFRRAGWRTGSFSASPLGSTLSALERGFDAVYPPRFWRSHAQLDMNPAASQLHGALLAWIDEQPDRPFFAYVHTLEVHEWKLQRYQTGRPEGFSAYDAAILDADQQLGDLVASLTSRRPERDLVIVVVSDHGESWGDHGMPSHGFGLYQSQIHIPLIFWKSGGGLRPRPVTEPVSLSDLGPTLLEALGLPPLDDVDGHSLAAALAGGEAGRGPVLSALLRFVWAPAAPRQYSVTTPEQRVRILTEGGAARSYDLVIDPQQLQPLRQPDPSLTKTLDELLAEQHERAAAFEARHGPIVRGPITADDSARLRALGYLEAGDGALVEESRASRHQP